MLLTQGSSLGGRKLKSSEMQRDKFDDLMGIALFCAIGLLVSLNLILRYPDFGVLIQEFNLF